MSITNEEKIQIIESRLSTLDFCIQNLSDGIAQSPDSDMEGKTPRAEVLSDLMLQRQALIDLKETLV